MENLNNVLQNISQKQNGNVKFPIIEKREFLETHIDMLDLDMRSSNVLMRNKIHNVQGILNNIKILPQLKGCGIKTTNRILYKICAYYYATLSEKDKKTYLEKIKTLNERD